MAGTGAGSRRRPIAPAPTGLRRLNIPAATSGRTAPAALTFARRRRRQTLAGQTHFVKPAAIGPALTLFFAA